MADWQLWSNCRLLLSQFSSQPISEGLGHPGPIPDGFELHTFQSQQAMEYELLPTKHVQQSELEVSPLTLTLSLGLDSLLKIN